MSTTSSATSVANFISFTCKSEHRRRIGFRVDPEEVKEQSFHSSADSIHICEEYLKVILSSFQEWFHDENNGGLFNDNHDTKFLNKINAARLLYRKGDMK